MSFSKSGSGSSGLGCTELVVLLLDDDDGFRQALAANLREDGHDVHDFENPGALPDLTELQHVHVLITDYCFGSGEDGLQLSQRFHTAHPGKPAILLTSYSDDIVETRILSLEFVRTLNKPLRYEHLHDLVHHLTT